MQLNVTDIIKTELNLLKFKNEINTVSITNLYFQSLPLDLETVGRKQYYPPSKYIPVKPGE